MWGAAKAAAAEEGYASRMIGAALGLGERTLVFKIIRQAAPTIC
jgi:hypothetical protein